LFDVVPTNVGNLSNVVERVFQISRRIKERVITLNADLVFMSLNAKHQSAIAGSDGATIFFDVVTARRPDLPDPCCNPIF
jgi:hypothetical protein